MTPNVTKPYQSRRPIYYEQRGRRFFRTVTGPLGVPEGAAGGFKKWRRVLNRDPCVYCGRKVNKRKRTMDHIVPKSQGGPDGWTNRAGACQRCDYAKRDTPMLIYLLERANSGSKS